MLSGSPQALAWVSTGSSEGWRPEVTAGSCLVSEESVSLLPIPHPKGPLRCVVWGRRQGRAGGNAHALGT